MKKNEEGIDLAETMVAIILIVAAILSVTVMLIKSQVTQADNEAQARATLIVQDHLEKSRQIGYHSLVSNMKDSATKPTICTTTAATKTTAQKKEYTDKLPCSSGSNSIMETYIAGNFGSIPYTSKQTVSGTEYTVGFHVTRLSPQRADQTGWGNIAARNGGKCNATPGTNDLPNPNATPYKEDISKESDFYPTCTVKHITVEVSWTDTAGNLKSTSGSWMRAPQIYEEVPPNFLEN